MASCKFIASAAAIVLPAMVVAQDGGQRVPDVSSIVADGRNIHSTVSVPFLGNTLINVHRIGERYYFIPNPVADWSSFNSSVVRLCNVDENVEYHTVPLGILMFEGTTIRDLADGSGIEETMLSPVPSYGYSIFYRIGNGPANLLETTINTGALLKGESMSAETNLPKNISVLVQGSCNDLKRIGAYAKITVSLHVIGKSFTTSSFSAEVALHDAVQMELDADQDEEEVDEVTITSSSSGSGFGISVGPISFGSSSGGSSTNRSSQRYRAIDTEWTQRVVNRATTDIDIQEICDQSNCPENVNKSLMDFLNQFVDNQRARVSQQSDQSLQLTFDGIPGSRNVNISEELRVKLNTLWERASSEEAEVDGVKVKRTDDNKLLVDGDTEWVRSGEQWIPTSFSALMLNETELTNQINMTYSRTVLAASELVSVLAGQQDPFSREPGRYQHIPTLFERASEPEDWPLECTHFVDDDLGLRLPAGISSGLSRLPLGSGVVIGNTMSVDAFSNDMEAISTVPPGYFLAGGYCSFTNVLPTQIQRPVRSEMITDADGSKGWRCLYDGEFNQIGFAAQSFAIGCRLADD